MGGLHRTHTISKIRRVVGGTGAGALGGIVQLLGLDYTAPVQQSFPTTADGVIPGRTASEIWRFDMASGNAVGKVGAKVLTASGALVYEQVIVGMFNGTDMHSVKAAGFDAILDKFEGTTTDYDYDKSESIAFVMFVRFRAPAVTSIFGKRNGSSEGYRCYLTGAGVPNLVVEDDAASAVNIASGITVTDGAVHEIRVELNKTDAKVYLSVDGETRKEGVIPAGDTSSSATEFAIGRQDMNIAPFDILYFAVFRGADAEGVTNDIQVLTHATDPGTGGIFPQLDTYTRATLACPVVGNESGYGLRVGKFASGQFAIGWDTDFSHTSKLGILIEEAGTNLCKGSEEAATGADYADIGTPSKTSNAKESPDGTQTMNRIAATGAQEGREQTITVTAVTEYTASLFGKRGIDGTDCFAEIEIYDVTNGATIDTLQIDLNADNLCVRPDITITTPAGCVSIKYRLKVDDGSDIAEWGWQFETGDHATSYIPTTTASAATRNKTDCQLTNAGGSTYLKSAAGEIEIVCALTVDVDVQRTVLDVSSGSGNADRILAEVLTGGDLRVRLWDSGGTLRQTIDATDPGNWDQEHTIRIRWDSANGVDDNAENADVILDGVRTAGSATTWTAGANATDIDIGQTQAAADQVNGGEATIKVWDAPRAA